MIPPLPDAASLSRWRPELAVRAVSPLAGDGSARRYFRVFLDAGTRVLLVGPDPAENAAFVRVALHLAGRGIRVPQVFEVDEASGWILLEDVGDENLLTAARGAATEDEREALYAPVLALLARMQIEGARGFTLETGFATAPYGPALMVEHEGLYFVHEFCGFLLGLPVDPAPLAGELETLAKIVERVPGGYFLHRDFQSRNLHRVADGWAVLDFQGARPGPLAYDAAALILDPYAAHGPELRRRLLARYLSLLEGRADAGAVAESFPVVGVFRLLQALGAFAKLGGRLGKPGFLEHAGAALEVLTEMLEPLGGRAPRLRSLALAAREAWNLRARDDAP